MRGGAYNVRPLSVLSMYSISPGSGFKGPSGEPRRLNYAKEG